jgi:hypothetical protein
MNKNQKKKPAKKRSYNRKPRLIESLPKPEDKDTEVETLALMCSVIDNWDAAQKNRNLNFIFSKYGKHINPFKVN